LSVTNAYDSLERPRAVALASQSSTLVTYGYDGASRLLHATNGTHTASYSYLTGSSLISQIAFKQSTTTRMTATRQYDKLNRLTNIVSTPSGSGQPVISFAYGYNLANQRTNAVRGDGSYWVYQYDGLGQVVSGKRYWADGSPVAGQQFDYAYDDIGNRKSAGSGGNQWGTSLRYEHYTANNLNQYTQRTVPPWFNVMGEANSAATVTVNNNATYRKGQYFRAELPANNAGAPFWVGLTNLAVIDSSGDKTNLITGNLYVPPSTETYTYDHDGNMLSDGRWSYTWDAENRLIALETLTAVANAGVPKQKLVFQYDAQSRRISKVVSNWTGSAWTLNYQRKFVYDGWNLLAELDASNNLVRSYVWGTDLSGTPQGAGGVGGLLMVRQVSGTAGTHFVGYDGNGNVSVLVNAANGNVTAEYEYDPFGKTLRATGDMAALNPFRFSTKYTDGESEFLYYGYRYYDPSAGRWVNRDPIEEEGGSNLYGFVQNWPTFHIDIDGRRILRPPPPDTRPISKRIQVCQRDIKTDGGGCFDRCSIALANFWQGHTYLQIVDDSGNPIDTRGSRYPSAGKGEGPWPEPLDVKPNSCSPCRKTTGTLSHGSSGKAKPGTQASDEEIWDCIKNHSLTRRYHELRYNCNDWTKEAQKACGIQCPF
jgi:RHS repeat-associated protein